MPYRSLWTCLGLRPTCDAAAAAVCCPDMANLVEEGSKLQFPESRPVSPTSVRPSVRPSVTTPSQVRLTNLTLDLISHPPLRSLRVLSPPLSPHSSLIVFVSLSLSFAPTEHAAAPGDGVLQLPHHHHDALAEERDRRAGVQCLRTLLQAARGTCEKNQGNGGFHCEIVMWVGGPMGGWTDGRTDGRTGAGNSSWGGENGDQRLNLHLINPSVKEEEGRRNELPRHLWGGAAGRIVVCLCYTSPCSTLSHFHPSVRPSVRPSVDAYSSITCRGAAAEGQAGFISSRRGVREGGAGKSSD